MSTTLTLPESPKALAPSAPVSGTSCQRKRWMIADFDRLLDHGFFREGGPEFLWDGEIYLKKPVHPPHFNAVSSVVDLLKARFPAAHSTIYQDAPVELREAFKPRPDVSVLRGPRATFRTRAPASSDVILIVEVSDTTYADDNRAYLHGNAATGIPLDWIVNIPARRIEVYTEPWSKEDGPAGYATRRDFGREQSIPIDGSEPVAVADVLRDSLEPPTEPSV